MPPPPIRLLLYYFGVRLLNLYSWETVSHPSIWSVRNEVLSTWNSGKSLSTYWQIETEKCWMYLLNLRTYFSWIIVFFATVSDFGVLALPTRFKRNRPVLLSPFRLPECCNCGSHVLRESKHTFQRGLRSHLGTNTYVGMLENVTRLAYQAYYSGTKSWLSGHSFWITSHSAMKVTLHHRPPLFKLRSTMRHTKLLWSHHKPIRGDTDRNNFNMAHTLQSHCTGAVQI